MSSPELTDAEKMLKYVVPDYRRKRTFYHSQEHFGVAREALRKMLVRDGIESVLDIGCGHGLGSLEIMASGIRYVGIDPIKGNVEQARTDNPRGDFRVGFAQELPFPDKSFDAVMNATAWEILPTPQDCAVAMREMLRVARRRVYSLDSDPHPRFMVERYLSVPPKLGLEIRRVHYNPDKDKAYNVWTVNLEGITA